MLNFLIIGLSDGSIFALAALGLALSYKTSGVFNFAHGAVAAGGAYVFYQCHFLSGLPSPVAALIAVAGYGSVMGLLLERFAARLEAAPTALKIVGTLGVLLVIQYAAQIHYGTQSRPFDQFLPTHRFRLGHLNVEADQIVVIVLAGTAAATLSLLFRRTRLGLAMRAVVDDSHLVDLNGIDPIKVRRSAWLIGAWFASLSGILIAPRMGLDATLLTLLVVQAYAAGAIGAFTNLPLVYAGGLLVGTTQQLVTYWASKTNNITLGSLPASVPFIVLFAILLVLPKRRLQEIGRVARPRPFTATPPPRAARFALGGAGVAILLVLPRLVGPRLPIWSAGLTQAVVFLSLALLVRSSNQVSLCQIGFAAVGAAAFAHFAGQLGAPWLLALLLSGLVAVPLGAFIALPAIRLAGLFLALATFGFGILLQQVFYRTSWMFGSANGIRAPRPGFSGLHLSSDTGYYYVIVAVVLLAAAAVSAVEHSRLGRLLGGLADSPVALATHGADVKVTRILVFCISAFLAGIGGALFAPLNGSVNGTTFPYFNSIALLAVLAVASANLEVLGVGSTTIALVSSVLFEVIPGYVTSGQFSLYLQVVFGVAALLAAISSQSDPAGRLRALSSTARRHRRGPAAERRARPTPTGFAKYPPRANPVPSPSPRAFASEGVDS